MNAAAHDLHLRVARIGLRILGGNTDDSEAMRRFRAGVRRLPPDLLPRVTDAYASLGHEAHLQALQDTNLNSVDAAGILASDPRIVGAVTDAHPGWPRHPAAFAATCLSLGAVFLALETLLGRTGAQA